jgi:hypothetical protein
MISEMISDDLASCTALVHTVLCASMVMRSNATWYKSRDGILLLVARGSDMPKPYQQQQTSRLIRMCSEKLIFS